MSRSDDEKFRGRYILELLSVIRKELQIKDPLPRTRDMAVAQLERWKKSLKTITNTMKKMFHVNVLAHALQKKYHRKNCDEHESLIKGCQCLRQRMRDTLYQLGKTANASCIQDAVAGRTPLTCPRILATLYHMIYRDLKESRYLLALANGKKEETREKKSKQEKEENKKKKKKSKPHSRPYNPLNNPNTALGRALQKRREEDEMQNKKEEAMKLQREERRRQKKKEKERLKVRFTDQ